MKLTAELDDYFHELVHKQEHLNAQDMTGKQKAFEHNKKLIDAMGFAFYGEPISDLVEKAEQAEQKAEQLEQKAEQLEQEKNKILQASVLHFSQKMNFSPIQIAEILEIELSIILDILEKYGKL